MPGGLVRGRPLITLGLKERGRELGKNHEISQGERGCSEISRVFTFSLNARCRLYPYLKINI